MKRKYAVDGWWTAIQIDHAVMMFGSKVESLLNEYDSKGKQKYKLENLLRKPSEPIADRQVTRLPRNSGLVSPKPTARKHSTPTAQETT